MFIDQFKAQLPNGGARPNHFRIELISPIGSLTSDKVELLCKAASLPATTMNDIPVMYRGRAVHVAGEQSFQPWTVTIINADDFHARNVLEQWSDLIQNYDQTNGEKNVASYVRDLTVNQLDRNDNPLYTYIFRNAYPVNVIEIQLTYDAPNQVEEFAVTFMYDYYKPSGVFGGLGNAT